jgi:predicted metal-binding protein
MISKNVNPVVDHEVLVCETCLDFFSNRAEFEGHRSETRHSDSTVLLKAVSATKVEEEKVVVFFDLPQ